MYNADNNLGSKYQNERLLHSIKWNMITRKHSKQKEVVPCNNRYKRQNNFLSDTSQIQEPLILHQETQDQETNTYKLLSSPQSQYQSEFKICIRQTKKQNKKKKKSIYFTEPKKQRDIIQFQQIQQIEEIHSQQFMDKLQITIYNLPNDDIQFIEQNTTNQENSFEFIYLLLTLDLNSSYQQIQYALNEQYEEIDYIKPKLVSKNKFTKKNEKFTKNSEINSITISDLMSSAKQKAEISLVECQYDNIKLYGQLGYDRGKKIIGHSFGISVTDPTQKKFSFDVYFLMEFMQREDCTQPKENYATKLQVELYEKQLLMDYLQENRQYLPNLAEEILD